MANEGKHEDAEMDCENEGSEEITENNETEEESSEKVYLPGQPLNVDEELVHDPSAYVMLHEAQSGAPCLSFDIIPDKLGERRETFPLSAYIVAGTQAAHADGNDVLVMKMSNMLRTQKDKDDESDEEAEDDDDDSTPHLECARLRHAGCVNRIRCYVHEDAILAASWSELGQVSIYNLGDALQAVQSKEDMKNYKNDARRLSPPIFTFSGHRTEGFGLDWCSTNPGMLATGDCKQNIHIWRPVEGGTWHVDQRPLVGHKDSVEDLQWSPNENNVLASCSVDKSIRIWDTRAPPNKACMLTVSNAHESDVNVINWNRNEPFIVSGGDDAVLHIWDLRQFQTGSAVATFKHHSQPVTTVEWHPSEATIFASGGSDDQIALWDLSLERDTDDMSDDVEKIPPQLLFIHQGQTDIKELHWHPQLPGVIISTALSGFNIFRTISV